MNGVHQTIFGTSINDPRGPGNCTQAAVASMLDLPLADVPHFVELTLGDPRGDAWFHVLTSWSLDRFGFTWICAEPDELRAIEWPPGEREQVLYLAGGRTPRGAMHSVVVDANLELIWDPHPSGIGVDDVLTVDVPVLREPDAEGLRHIVFVQRWIEAA